VPSFRTVVRNLTSRAGAAWQQLTNPTEQISQGQYLAVAARAMVEQAKGGKRPPTGEIQDIPVNVAPLWTVPAIQDAVGQFGVGSFGQAALLTESMLSDDRVQAGVNGRVKGVTKCVVKLEPSKTGNGAKRKRVARDIEALWPELFPEETLEQLLTWTIFMGFCLCEIVWETREDRWLPRLKVWHPLYIYYQVDIRRYVAITMEGTIVVEPNDPRWFLYTPFGAYRGWLRGAVRSCSIPWIVRQFALRDWARYSEVHGLPQKKVKYPAQAPADAKASFFASIKRLGAETAFALPQQAGVDAAAWDIELLEARDGSWKGFQGLIAQCDGSITLAIRGTNLTTEVKDVGSKAAASVHGEQDSDYARADGIKLAAAIQNQVLRWYCLYNEGDGGLAPLPVFEEQVSEDRHEQALAWLALSQSVTGLKGWPIDIVKLADQFGIPLIEGAEVSTDEADPEEPGDPTEQQVTEESPDVPEEDSEEDIDAPE
jgi:phage gp29-like protein